jgi:hypothetical protein
MIYKSCKKLTEYYEECETFTKKYTENVGGISEWHSGGNVTFGEPEDAPKKEQEVVLSPIKMTMLFFRSEDSSKSEINLGKADKTYQGEFGFDSYHKSITEKSRVVKDSLRKNSAIDFNLTFEGKTKYINYKDFTITDDAVDKIDSYYVPWLSLKTHQAAKIKSKLFYHEKSFKDYFKTQAPCEVKFRVVENGETNEPYFECETTDITIAPASVMIDKKKKNESLLELTITAGEHLNKNLSILAYFTDSANVDHIIGQINCLVYKPLELKIKFFDVKLQTAAGVNKYHDSITVDTRAVTTYLNQNSLNQAGIEVVAGAKANLFLNENDATKISIGANNEAVPNTTYPTIGNLLEEVDLKKSEPAKTYFTKDKIVALKGNNALLSQRKQADFELDHYINKKYVEYITAKLKAPLETLLIKYKDSKSEMHNRDDFDAEMLYKVVDFYRNYMLPVFLLQDITGAINLTDPDNPEWNAAFEIGSENDFKKKVCMTKVSLIHGAKLYNTYAHELAHALSLDHTFDPIASNGLGIGIPGNRELTLENFMDYYKNDNKNVFDEPKSFFKVQFDTMQKSHEERTQNEAHLLNALYDDNNLLREKDEFKLDIYEMFHTNMD